MLTNLVDTIPDFEERSGQIKMASAVENALKETLEHFGTVDFLLNGAGGSHPTTTTTTELEFFDIDPEAVQKVMDLNYLSAVIPSQAVGRVYADKGEGAIVNITSISVVMPIPGLDLSSAARAGLTSFLAGVAPKVAAQNVTINNILPGFFLTDRHNTALKQAMDERDLSLEEAIAERAEPVPAKRFGIPEEFGEACAFLCGSNAGYITGQNLVIDGGRYPGAF